MTNKEKIKEIASIHGFFHTPSIEFGAEKMAEWKDSQYHWNERMHEQALNQNITNKEFREMLSKMPDDALVAVECCCPRAMVYDKEYNLIRID